MSDVVLKPRPDRVDRIPDDYYLDWEDELADRSELVDPLAQASASYSY